MNQTNKKYLEKFISSMKTDYKKWTINVSCGINGCFYEYYSPTYKNIKFGFGSVHEGAWINGQFKWEVPYNVLLNPFNKYFWSYRKAKKTIKQYLITERNTAFNKNLIKEIEQIDDRL